MSNDLGEYYNPSGESGVGVTTAPSTATPIIGAGESITPQRDILGYLKSIGLSGSSGSSKSLMDLITQGLGSQFASAPK